MSEPPAAVGNDAEEKFHLAYGAALAAWAMVESALGDLFEMTIGGSPLVANRVFFSARSFLGRVEMLQAAIRAAGEFKNSNAEGLETFRVITKKAAEWSADRNILAHDIPVLDMRLGSKSVGEFVIMSGSGKWKSGYQQSDVWYQNCLTIMHMSIMRMNFLSFSSLIKRAGNEFTWLPDEELRTLRKLVLQLPKDARSSGPNTSSRAPRQPPKPLPG